MFCDQCGSQLEEETKFCGKCGAKVESGIPVQQSSTQSAPFAPNSAVEKNTVSEVEIDPKLRWIPSALAIAVPILIRQGVIPLPDGYYIDVLAVLGILWIFLGGKILRKFKGNKK